MIIIFHLKCLIIYLTLSDTLPWTYAWLIKCILYLCVGLIIIMLPICISGASVSLGVGPLFRFGIDYCRKDKKNTNDRQGNSLENVDKRDPIQIILQVIHSPLNVVSNMPLNTCDTFLFTHFCVYSSIKKKTF